MRGIYQFINKFVFFFALGGASPLFAITLDELFWDSPSQIAFLPYDLVATFLDDETRSFLIKSHNKGTLSYIVGSGAFDLGKDSYRFDRIENETIFLTNQNGVQVKVAAARGHVRSNIKASFDGSNLPPSARSKMEFYSGDRPLEELRMFAQKIGVPSALTNFLSVLPERGRSRSGRPGWLLNDKLPPAFFAIVPFEKGDLILSIDGISAHDIEDVMAYVKAQEISKLYKVEIERDKKLKIIEIYIE